MSTLALTRPGAGERGRGRTGRAGDGLRATPSLFDDLGGEPTLDELLAGVWEGLAARRVVVCPVCAGEMRPEYGAHAQPVGGRCTHCDTAVG